MSATPIADALEGAALRYATNGYPVFPIHTPTGDGTCSCGGGPKCKPGKHPRTPNGLNDATTNPEQIRAWWSKWPDANIGIATGGTRRLVILDVDDPDALQHLPAELADTYTSQTGRAGGGRHHWYHAPIGVTITNRRGNLPVGIDIRGDGGYIIAPPSLHATGERYRAADRRPIVELPGMIISLVAAPPPRSVEQRTPPTTWIEADGTAYGLRALELEAASVAATTEGGRNERLNTAAFSLGQLVAGKELAEAAAVDALEQAAEACGLDHTEASGTIKRGLEAGQQKPRSAPEATTPTNRPTVERHGAPKPHPKWSRTDQGNAERLVYYHGADLRYCAPWRSWLVWDGLRWKRDDDGQAIRYAKDAARQIPYEATLEADEKAYKETLKFAYTSLSLSKMTAMLALAQSEPGIHITPDDLDADPYLLNTSNGTIDLRTGQTRPADRGDLITKLAPTNYNPDAACQFYDSFLDRVFAGDEHLIGFVQRVAGLSILGTTSERILPICHGAGANGKSTLLEVWQRVLGDYADQADADNLLLARRTGSSNTPELADLHGKRLVITSETSEGRKLDVARVKAITGGDTVRACRKFENPFSFVPSHTVWLATNHRPRITDDGEAIWDRVHLIPFGVTFPIAERIPRVDLDARLDQDAPGILAWLVAGAINYHQNGVGTIPPSVRIATDEYRSAEDVVGTFLDDKTELIATSSTASGRLHKAYKEWCDERGERPLDARGFGERLERKGFKRHKTNTSNVWLNLHLKDESIEN